MTCDGLDLHSVRIYKLHNAILAKNKWLIVTSVLLYNFTEGLF